MCGNNNQPTNFDGWGLYSLPYDRLFSGFSYLTCRFTPSTTPIFSTYPYPSLVSLPNLFKLPEEIQELCHKYLKAEWERLYDDGALEAELESWGLTESNPWSWWKGHLKRWLTLLRILRGSPPTLYFYHGLPVLHAYLFSLALVHPEDGFGLSFLRFNFRSDTTYFPKGFGLLYPHIFPPISFILGSAELANSSVAVVPPAMLDSFFPSLRESCRNNLLSDCLTFPELLRITYFHLFYSSFTYSIPNLSSEGEAIPRQYHLYSVWPANPVLMNGMSVDALSLLRPLQYPSSSLLFPTFFPVLAVDELDNLENYLANNGPGVSDLEVAVESQKRTLSLGLARLHTSTFSNDCGRLTELTSSMGSRWRIYIGGTQCMDYPLELPRMDDCSLPTYDNSVVISLLHRAMSSQWSNLARFPGLKAGEVSVYPPIPECYSDLLKIFKPV